MSNPYYNHGTTPATNSSGSSALVRAEFDSITSGFALLPPLTPGGFVVGNAGGSALAMSSNVSESGTTVTLANALTVAGVLTVNGNAGFGGAPSWNLDVRPASGNSVIASRAVAASTAYLSVAGNGAVPLTGSFDIIQDNQFAYIWQRANLPLLFATNSAEKMRLDALGGLILGGSAPATASGSGTVVSSINAASIPVLDLLIGGTRTGTFLGLSTEVRVGAIANIPLTLYAGGSEKVRVNAAGDLLVGTTVSLQGQAGRGTIEVNGTSDAIIEFKKSNVGQGFVYFDASGNGFMSASQAAALNFLTNGATRLTLNSAGSVLDGSSNTFQPINRAVKTAATARNSTIALADDPHLVVPLSIGTWSYRVWLPVWCTTANTGQFKFAVAYSGTSTTNLMGAFASKSVNSSDFRQMVAGASGFGGFAPTVGSSPTDYVVAEGVLVATGAGNISVQWCQSVSDVNAVNVGLGGYITCTKLA